MKPLFLLCFCFITLGIFAQIKPVLFSIKADSKNCINKPVSFKAVYDMPFKTTFYWNFGDPNSGTSNYSTAQNPTHSFSMPGTFQVTLTVTDENGCVGCTSYVIEIASNCCAFDEKIVYNDNDYPTGEIITNTTWSTFKRFNKTIIIKAGNTLTINTGVTIEFGPFGRLIIENGDYNQSIEGAQLIMNEGSRLTSIYDGDNLDCPVMWQGVEVWGNASLSHCAASLPFHGKITMLSGDQNKTTIEYAHIGVLLGRRNICFVNTCDDQASLCKKTPYVLTHSGGVINTTNSKFFNNAVSVHFAAYKYINASIINNCLFEGSNLLDPGYNTNNVYVYENNNISTSHNPLFGNANPTQHAITGIYMWSVRNVTLTGNTFGHDDGPYLIEGIKSYDSPYNVSTSLFQNLDYGIRIFNSNSTVGANKIFDNFLSLQNNYGFKNIIEYPLQIEGTRFTQIINNTIGNEYASSPWSTSGILLKNSMNFRVQDNEFYKINRGIEVINSSPGFSKGITNGFGGGRIASLNSPDGNNFVECPLDIETKGYNQRLQLHCNTSTNTDPDYYNDSNWENYGYFTHQGQEDFSTEARNPAGNAFNPSDNDPRKIINNNFELLQIPHPNALPVYYTYYRHGGTLAPERIPSSQSLQYNINAASSAYNAQTSCLPCSTSTGSYRSVLQDMEAEYDSLVAVYDTVFSNLDSNATQLLLDSINGSMNDDSLLVLLLAHSPLSDTVIAAALNRPLSTNSIDDLLIPNSPLSDVGRYYLNIIIDTLPSEIKGRILEVQAHNTNYTTLSSLDRDMLVLENSYQLQLNSFIEYLLENDSLLEAITILDSLDNNDAKRLVLSTYLADSNYTEVASRLENFEPLTEEEEDWKDLFSLLYELATDSLTVFDMDSTQDAFVRALAEDNSCSPASVNAQAILRLLYEEEFPECPTAFQERKASILWPASKQMAVSGYLGQNIPNPFSNTTSIPYYLPENTAHAAICVYDITGKKIYETVLQNNKGTISLTLDNFKAGIYLYSLIIDNKPIQTKRMVLIK